MVVGTFNYLENNENFNVKYLNTHIKTCLIKTETNSYVITSSGNFNQMGKSSKLL